MIHDNDDINNNNDTHPHDHLDDITSSDERQRSWINNVIIGVENFMFTFLDYLQIDN